MTRFALDTNIVSYYLKGDKKLIAKINDITADKNIIVIPPIVFFEVKRWLLAINAQKKLRFFETMYSASGIGVIDEAILEDAALLYVKLQKSGIVLGDNDILIAAFCVKHELTLVTNNIKHFQNIPLLNVINWKTE